MAKGIMVVESEPGDPEGEAGYNRWYREVHIPELLAVPGFVSARRYRVFRELAPGPSAKQKYLAIYEIEADDLGEVLSAMRQHPRSKPEGSGAPALSPATVVTVYQLEE